VICTWVSISFLHRPVGPRGLIAPQPRVPRSNATTATAIATAVSAHSTA
jgi:hypothetical protein